MRKTVRNKKVIQARQRIEEARKNVTEDKKLCNRTTSALDYLLRYKQLSYILEALMNLGTCQGSQGSKTSLFFRHQHNFQN